MTFFILHSAFLLSIALTQVSYVSFRLTERTFRDRTHDWSVGSQREILLDCTYQESESEESTQKYLRADNVERCMESTIWVFCPPSSSSSISAAVKMDASQWREEPCGVSIALHCRKLITTLPSKITPIPTCPTLTAHPSLNLPPPRRQPRIQPQPA